MNSYIFSEKFSNSSIDIFSVSSDNKPLVVNILSIFVFVASMDPLAKMWIYSNSLRSGNKI